MFHLLKLVLTLNFGKGSKTHKFMNAVHHVIQTDIAE